MLILTTRGWLSLSSTMPRKLLIFFIVLCLGRQEPEGGVVLGIEILFIIFYILLCNDYYDSCWVYTTYASAL